MSNNKSRGNTKSKLTFANIIGQRSGKAQAAALLEVYDEMSVHPPASQQEVETFLRLHIKRCRVNLAGAKDRGDNRAAAHLERKLAVYEYLTKVLNERKEGNKPIEAMRECPNCRVTSVDNFGHCHCCGGDF